MALSRSSVVAVADDVAGTNASAVTIGEILALNPGDMGPRGTAGATWLSGSTAPTPALGSNGDFYLNTTTREVSKKQNGVWVKAFTMPGATPAPVVRSSSLLHRSF